MPTTGHQLDRATGDSNVTGCCCGRRDPVACAGNNFRILALAYPPRAKTRDLGRELVVRELFLIFVVHGSKA